MNYDGKKFKVISNSENGDVSSDMIFEYRQVGEILSSEYSGENISEGHLIGIVDEDGTINMRYRQINPKGQEVSGICMSTPELMPNGKIRLTECQTRYLLSHHQFL